MNFWTWFDDSNIEPILTQPGSICYLDEKKLCLFAIFTSTRDEFHELNFWTIWSSVVSPDWQILLGLGGQGATNMIPVLPVRYQVQILNYVTNVTMARTRIMLSLSWILLWNVSGWLWPLGRMTWSPSLEIFFVIARLLKRFEVLI